MSGVFASQVSAVLVTRGDVDLAPIFESLHGAGIREIVEWDNSTKKDLAVYGRYAAIENIFPFELVNGAGKVVKRGNTVVLVQDDDVILPADTVRALCEAYEPGVLVANMPQRFRPHYPDSCLVGFGAVFDRDLPERALGRFANAYGPDRVLDVIASDPGFYHRTCDVVFTTLTPRKLVDLPYTEREFASDANRMWKQASHFGERQRMLELARQVRDAETIAAWRRPHSARA